MARLNIEDCWWTDPRRSALIRLVGDEDLADARAIRAWRLAQEFWKFGRGLVPRGLFETLQSYAELLSVGLAEIREDKVYIRGSSTHLEWIVEAKEGASRGGKASAQRPRDEKGRLTKIPDHDPSEVQATSKQGPSESKCVQGSLSSSSSSSSSLSRKTKKNTPLTGARFDYPEIYEEIWKQYQLGHKPAKGDKGDCFLIFEGLKLNPSELVNLKKAIAGYRFTAKDEKYRVNFEKFLKSDWRVHLEANTAPRFAFVDSTEAVGS